MHQATSGKPTSDAVLEGLTWLEKEVTSRDVAVLFLAGHERMDEKNRYYFLTTDTDIDKLRSTAVGRDAIRGAVVFASSQGREVSLENEAWGNGAFTKALVRGLGEGAADLIKDGKITTSELDAYVTETLKTMTRAGQHPVMQRPPTAPDFPIALMW